MFNSLTKESPANKKMYEPQSVSQLVRLGSLMFLNSPQVSMWVQIVVWLYALTLWHTDDLSRVYLTSWPMTLG